MKNLVTFAPEKEFRYLAEKVFQKHQKLIKNRLPQAEVYHVGSTAIVGSLTKGDVDLQVRVDQEDFPEAKATLMELYEINEGSSQTSFFCSFEVEDEILPLGVQLTVVDSEIDHFWKVTQFFNEYPEYVDSYNLLKRKYEGNEMEKYRKEKGRFFNEILDSDEYNRFIQQLDN